jgi:hypothetical protein
MITFGGSESERGGRMGRRFDHPAGYYAAFLEDPCGDRFEVCLRKLA